MSRRARALVASCSPPKPRLAVTPVPFEDSSSPHTTSPGRLCDSPVLPSRRAATNSPDTFRLRKKKQRCSSRRTNSPETSAHRRGKKKRRHLPDTPPPTDFHEPRSSPLTSDEDVSELAMVFDVIVARQQHSKRNSKRRKITCTPPSKQRISRKARATNSPEHLRNHFRKRRKRKSPGSKNMQNLGTAAVILDHRDAVLNCRSECCHGKLFWCDFDTC